MYAVNPSSEPISPLLPVVVLLLSINMLNSIASIARHQHKPQFPSFCLPPLRVSFPSIPHSRCLAKVLPHLLPKSDPRFLFSMFVSAHACVFHWWTFLLFTCSYCGAGRSRWRTATPTHRRRRPWEKRYPYYLLCQSATIYLNSSYRTCSY